MQLGRALATPTCLISLATLLTACGPQHFDNPRLRTDLTATQPIIGGQPASEEDYAPVGALVFTFPGERSQMFCTGTLIAPDVILTASHCLDGIPELQESGAELGFSLQANVRRLRPHRTESPFATFSQAIKHPHYRSDFLIPSERLEGCQDPAYDFIPEACDAIDACQDSDEIEWCINDVFNVFMQACEPYRHNACNTDPTITCTGSVSDWCQELGLRTFGLMGLSQPADIGLVFLDSAIEDIKPAPILHSKQAHRLDLGTEIHIVGYGQQSPEPGSPDTGEKIAARAKLNELSSHEIMVGGDEDGIQQCYGDSGGPAFLALTQGDQTYEVLVGVTSRSYNSEVCNQGGINTRTDSYLEWIQQEMYLGCERGTRVSCSGALEAQTALIIAGTTPVEGNVIEPVEITPGDELQAMDGGCAAAHSSPAAIPFWLTAIFLWARTLRVRREA